MTRELIGHSLERSSKLRSENNQLQEQNHTLREEHQCLLAELEQHVQEKVRMERDQYSRFVMVLHEKKSKIRGLQETIRTLQHNHQERDEDGEETEREKTVFDQSECGDNCQGTEESSQGFRFSQAPTILIHKDLNSPESSMEDSLCDGSDVLPSRKRRLLYPRSPEAKKPSMDLE